MSDGRKRILGPFTGCKKRKAQNKTTEKFMPVKRRQNLAETDSGHVTKRNGQKNFQTAKVHFTMVIKVTMMMRVKMKIRNNGSYRSVLSIVATKQFHQFFCKN